MTSYYIEQDNQIVLFDEDKQRLQNTIAFMPQYKGLEIKETERPIVDFQFADTPEYEQEQAQKEAERIAMLNLTGADVERGIYKARGMDFDDIIAFVEAQPLSEDGQPVVDIKALKIELKANNFYRGNPYVNAVGALLGFTSEQLDKFFETKDYKYLTTCTLTINAIPIEATVTGAGVYPYGATAHYKVELEGYKPYTSSIELLKDTELNIELEKIEEVVDENTTDTES